MGTCRQKEREKIANILQDQFISSFSDPNNVKKEIPRIENSNTLLSDIDFDHKDIIKAIDERFNASSSCPAFSIPATVLKHCKVSLSKPLLLMWKKSFATGTVPAYYKKQLITPIYKKR